MSRPTQLQKVQQRGLRVTPDEIATYAPDHRDLLICECLLRGETKLDELAEATELTPSAVRQRLLDEVRCAWISARVSEAVHTRLGNVLGAVYARVMRSGDPQAAKLLLQQFGSLLEKPKQVQHNHLHLDMSGMTEEQLRRYIEDKTRHLQATEVKAEPPDRAEEEE